MNHLLRTPLRAAAGAATMTGLSAGARVLATGIAAGVLGADMAVQEVAPQWVRDLRERAGSGAAGAAAAAETVRQAAPRLARDLRERAGAALTRPVPGSWTAILLTKAGQLAAEGSPGGVIPPAVDAAEAAEAVQAAGNLTDIGPRRHRRRVWSGRGHAAIEVRGLTVGGARRRRVADGVTASLRKLRGVRWAEINAVTAQVLVAFDEDSVSVPELVAAVRSAETAHQVRDEDFAWSRPEHPADRTPLSGTYAALAADLIGVGAGIAGRMIRLPAPHPAVRTVMAVFEGYPRARRILEVRIGPLGADLLLTVGNGVLYALAEGPARPAVDAGYRLLLAAELQARGRVWDGRGQELCFAGSGEAASGSQAPGDLPPLSPRPAPLPDGPIEEWTDRIAAGSLLAGTGVLAAAKDPSRAASALLAGLPRAGRLSREGFAAMLGRDLARHGVIPMDRSALRRLDRISAIVIDSAVLCTPRPRLLDVRADGGEETIWRAAATLLRDLSVRDLQGPGPWGNGHHQLVRRPGPLVGPDNPGGLTLTVLTAGGRRLGEVTVGCEFSPLAEAVLAAARTGGARLVLTRHASTNDLVARADQVTESDLAGCVRDLQSDGEGVLLVSASDGAALAAADVAVGCPDPSGGVCWSADLIAGPGLADVWRIVIAAGRAREVSSRGITLAAGTAALGALAAAVPRRRAPVLAWIDPVQSAGAAGLLMGAWSARNIVREPVPRPVQRIAWHAMEPQEALARLDRSSSPPEAGDDIAAGDGRRQSKALPVTLRALLRPAGELTEAVVGELRDPLTPVLLVGAAASAMLGSGVDSALVGGVMVGNALVGGLQRLRTERALADLLLREQQPARRLARQPREPLPGRPGDPDLPAEMVPAERLSPGDVIVLRPDDVVPADARLLVAEALEMDESTLTGESMPVTKDPAATVALPLAERTSMLYEGTTVLAGTVLAGTALAVVVATGAATEAGRAGAVAGGARPAGGVQARLGELTRIALPATGVGGMAVTALGLLGGGQLRDALASGVAVAVAAVPEGLPLVSTVAQLAAARRLSGHGVLVRSARTLEALGRVDVLCFDKTGTLTEGRLEVAGGASVDGSLDLASDRGRELLTVAARACPVPGERRITHATDRAVLDAAANLPPGAGWEVAHELPFQNGRGYHATLGREEGRVSIAVKGAPEVLLGACSRTMTGDGPGTRQVPLTADRRQAARQAVERLAADGLRVLAVAEGRPVPTDGGVPDLTDDLVRDLTLIGFVAIADVLRADAAAVVADLAAAEVRPVMITGDHPATAAAIARKVGIAAAEVLTGTDLDGLPEGERLERVGRAAVFARVTPEQKVRIIADLRRAGHVVAMTGDGTNDAAAIRLADVGIGVAAHGSTAARGASDLVLPGTDIAQIAGALREGRALWRSVRQAVAILVGGNAGEIAFMVAGTALAGRSPLNTRQLLLVNMLTDMFPALAVALGTSAAAEEETTGGPAASLLGASLTRDIAVRGGATALGATLAWTGGRLTGRTARASTMGLAAVVATQLGQTVVASSRSPVVLTTSAASAAALVVIVSTPGISQFFGCTPLGPAAWGIVAASSAAGTVAAALAPRVLPDIGGQQDTPAPVVPGARPGSRGRQSGRAQDRSEPGLPGLGRSRQTGGR
ncbi:MAG: HAD-IC family P-type ATPase [Streptosporangiaceae bacterium]